MDGSCESRLEDVEVTHSQQPLVYVTSPPEKKKSKELTNGIAVQVWLLTKRKLKLTKYIA